MVILETQASEGQVAAPNTNRALVAADREAIGDVEDFGQSPQLSGLNVEPQLSDELTGNNEEIQNSRYL